jgi:flagellar basal body-associated protein FliL
MFDSGAAPVSFAMNLGVPPGDVLKCALALARNERKLRRVLLSRLPMLRDRVFADTPRQPVVVDDG